MPSFYAGQKVRHQGMRAVIRRVRETKSGLLLDVHYTSGAWFGLESTVRPEDVEVERTGKAVA